MTTITIPRALLEQAMNALLLPCDRWNKQQFKIVTAATKAIRAELAKPEQEESFIPNWANYRQGVADGKAGSPKWHDAPTCAGLWVCNEGDDNPYRWTTHRVTFPLNQFLVGEDERWYGPIPQDAAIAKAEGDAIKKGG